MVHIMGKSWGKLQWNCTFRNSTFYHVSLLFSQVGREIARLYAFLYPTLHHVWQRLRSAFGTQRPQVQILSTRPRNRRSDASSSGLFFLTATPVWNLWGKLQRVRSGYDPRKTKKAPPSRKARGQFPLHRAYEPDKREGRGRKTLSRASPVRFAGAGG